MRCCVSWFVTTASGGAGFTRGTGLVGLKDRVEALDGRIFLDSPRAAGTTLRVELPLTDAGQATPANPPPRLRQPLSRASVRGPPCGLSPDSSRSS